MTVPYAEWASRVPGARTWVSSATRQPTRVLPDGCMDLLWMDGRAWVAGPDRRALTVPRPEGAPVAGLRFAPGHGPRVIGVPARVLRDQRVPLDDVWGPASGRRLIEQLEASEHPTEVLEAEAGQRLRAGASQPREELAAIDGITDALRTGTPVSAVAEDTGWSVRHFRRLCDEAFGYGPKLLARILRFQRSLALARRGLPFAAVAGRAGYSDQAHLARDVRDLAGVPLGRLLS